jgi:hypothetical protein
MMMIRNSKRCLAIGALVLLTSLFSLAQQADRRDKGCRNDDARGGKKCAQVPEGGSFVAYLFVAGSACVGAIFVRSRFRRPNLS